jgi:hypothetical protein
MAVSDAQNDKAGAPTKAESLVEYHELQQSCLLTAGITDPTTADARRKQVAAQL